MAFNKYYPFHLKILPLCCDLKMLSVYLHSLGYKQEGGDIIIKMIVALLKVEHWLKI